MSDLEYVKIPHCATRLEPTNGLIGSRFITSIPAPFVPGETTNTVPIVTQPVSPGKQSFTSIVLSSTLNLPNLPPSTPRDDVRLMSTREALSLQATTVNFRRFVGKSGSVFWLLDRLEEIVMWKRGWKLTCTWMAIYAFLCFFPRMILLIPHVILISILSITHDGHDYGDLSTSPKPLPRQPKEGTADWFANLQGIQNLMGTVSDAYDAVLSIVPILTWSTPYTPQLLTASCITLLLLLPVVIYIPLRPTMLVVGLTPFIISHPISLRILPTLLQSLTRTLKARTQRLVDNNNLPQKYWDVQKREIELWEHERWTVGVGWSKSSLKVDEKPWSTNDKELCEVVDGKGNVRDPIFKLSPKYDFIETEEWRLDLEGTWQQIGVDDYGWCYTNDRWQQPSPAPLEEWKSQGMTRERRWTRRMYLVQS